MTGIKNSVNQDVIFFNRQVLSLLHLLLDAQRNDCHKEIAGQLLRPGKAHLEHAADDLQKHNNDHNKQRGADDLAEHVLYLFESLRKFFHVQIPPIPLFPGSGSV